VLVAVHNKFQNKLLARLSPADLALLSGDLLLVDFGRGELLIEAHMPIRQACFIENGMASVVAATVNGCQAEVGIIGNEGMIDAATVLGSLIAPMQITMQMQGQGYSLSSGALQRAMAQSATLRAVMLDYAQAYLTELAQTALATATLTIKARLARRLLLCDDRMEGCEMTMTHESLSLVLSVRRPGVTEAVQFFERAGAIRARRGRIQIVDRVILQQIAGDD
jgi:CRP-like cAMP-binding protein